MSKRPYTRYTKEFKQEALRLADKTEQPVTQVARELHLRGQHLRGQSPLLRFW